MSRIMLLAILATITLSGCVDNGTDSEPVIVESPTDYEYLNDPAPGGHIHDYWGGKDKLDILEMSGSKTPLNGFGYNVRDYYWYPDTDIVIPQGTAEVRVTFDWSSETEMTHTQPELHYKTAVLREWTFADYIEDGKTIVIKTNNTHNDVPHQRLSAWEFSLWYTGDGPIGWMVKSNEVHIKIEAIKGTEIPVLPAHPDQWGENTSIQIFDWSSPTNSWFLPTSCLNACGQRAVPLEGAIVPFDSAYVEAKLTVHTDAAVTTYGDLDLAYHGSDTHEWTRLEPDRTEGNVHYYYIPIDGQADGPYSHETQWEFTTFNDQDSPSTNAFFDIEATVHRYEMPF